VKPPVAEAEMADQSPKRAKLEVADIFRDYGESYRRTQKLSGKQHAVMFDIENCRRSYFGYHIDICDQCGHTERFVNSCRNRHCPKCQGIGLYSPATSARRYALD